MRLRQVHDVDEVSLARSVRSRVVIAEDGEALTLADGGLGDERHQVVRHAARQFADQRRRMRSDRVEVPQRDSLDI